MVITDRDIRLFHYLFVHKVATSNHLRQDIFGHSSKQAVNSRMIKLIKAGLVEAKALRDSGNKTIYSLTKQSMEKYIGTKLDMERLQRKSDSPKHDLGLLEISRCLSKRSMVANYFTENVLLSGVYDHIEPLKEIRQLRPDAICEIHLDGKQVYLPLEYEASAKYAKRYDQLVSRYVQNIHVEGVLYVSKDHTIQRKVMLTEKRIYPNGGGKFLFALIQDILKDERELAFVSNYGEKLRMI